MINTNEVMFFRLSNGEDIVATIVFEDEKDIIVSNPLKVVYLPKGKGMLSISFMQWVFSKITMNQEFLIGTKDILTMTYPNTALIEHYFDTVEYFNKTETTKLNKLAKESDEATLDELFDEIEEELESGKASDALEFLNSLTSNNKGTLH